MAGNPMAQAQLEQAMAKMVGTIERAVDDEIDRLDNLGDGDLAKIRAKRLAEMKRRQTDRKKWEAAGHGSVWDVSDQPQFFEEVKKSERVVVMFYREWNDFSSLLDKALVELAPKHMETRFMRMNAEKAPFICERLSIRVMPSMVLFKKETVHDRIMGLDQIGRGDGSFTTKDVEVRLANSDIIEIDYTPDEDANSDDER